MAPAVPAAVLGGALLWLVLVLARRPPFREAAPARRVAFRLPAVPAATGGTPAAIAAGMAFLAAVLLRNLLAGALLAPLGWQVALALRRRRETAARREADVQVRACVDVVSEEMGVTGSARRALEQAAAVVTGEVREAVERALGANSLGRPLGEALEDAAEGRADLRALARLIALADDRSVEAARGLGRLAETLREREVLRANRQAEAAGARMVALLLLSAPLVIILVQVILSPAGAEILTRHGLGRAAVDWIAGTTSLAAWWLRRTFEEEDW